MHVAVVLRDDLADTASPDEPAAADRRSSPRRAPAAAAAVPRGVLSVGEDERTVYCPRRDLAGIVAFDAGGGGGGAGGAAGGSFARAHGLAASRRAVLRVSVRGALGAALDEAAASRPPGVVVTLGNARAQARRAVHARLLASSGA